MKRFLPLLLILCLFCSAVGCGNARQDPAVLLEQMTQTLKEAKSFHLSTRLLVTDPNQPDSNLSTLLILEGTMDCDRTLDRSILIQEADLMGLRVSSVLYQDGKDRYSLLPLLNRYVHEDAEDARWAALLEGLAGGSQLALLDLLQTQDLTMGQASGLRAFSCQLSDEALGTHVRGLWTDLLENPALKDVFIQAGLDQAEEKWEGSLALLSAVLPESLVQDARQRLLDRAQSEIETQWEDFRAGLGTLVEEAAFSDGLLELSVGNKLNSAALSLSYRCTVGGREFMVSQSAELSQLNAAELSPPPDFTPENTISADDLGKEDFDLAQANPFFAILRNALGGSFRS